MGTKSLRALHWAESKHPRDDRGRFANKGGGKWMARVAKDLQARFGDISMGAHPDHTPQGRLQTGGKPGHVLDIGGVRNAAKAAATTRQASDATAHAGRTGRSPTGTFVHGAKSATSSNKGVLPRAGELKPGDFATVRGTDQYGKVTKLTGHVQAASPVRMRKKGSKTAVERIAVQMAENPGGANGWRGTVYAHPSLAVEDHRPAASKPGSSSPTTRTPSEVARDVAGETPAALARQAPAPVRRDSFELGPKSRASSHAGGRTPSGVRKGERTASDVEAELAAARAALGGHDSSVGGGLTGKQHGQRVDANIGRAAKLAASVQRLERELEAKQAPKAAPLPKTRTGAKKGDLVLVKRTTRDFVIGKESTERTDYTYGVVGQVDKNGIVKTYSTNPDGSYPTPVRPGDQTYAANAEQVDVGAVMAAARAHTYPNSTTPMPFDSLDEAKALAKAHVGDQREKLAAAKAAAPKGRDPLRLQSGDRVEYQGVTAEVTGAPEAFENNRYDRGVRVPARNVDTGKEGFIRYKKSERARVLPAPPTAEVADEMARKRSLDALHAGRRAEVADIAPAAASTQAEQAGSFVVTFDSRPVAGPGAIAGLRRMTFEEARKVHTRAAGDSRHGRIINAETLAEVSPVAAVPEPSAVETDQAGITDPVDLARIRQAVEEHGGGYFGGPMGFGKGDAARYVTEGHLKDLVAEHGHDTVAAAVAAEIARNPGALDLKPGSPEWKAVQAAKLEASQAASKQALGAVKAGNIDEAQRIIGEAELANPAYREGGFSWSDMRKYVAKQAPALPSRTNTGEAASNADGGNVRTGRGPAGQVDTPRVSGDTGRMDNVPEPLQGSRITKVETISTAEGGGTRITGTFPNGGERTVRTFASDPPLVSGRMDKANAARKDMTREKLEISREPKDNGAKLKALENGTITSAELYRRAHAGPSGQRTNLLVGRIRHTPDNPSGEFKITDANGNHSGWASRTVHDGESTYVFHAEDADGGQRLVGWSDSLAVGADVLNSGHHQATGYGLDSSRVGGATFRRYDAPSLEQIDREMAQREERNAAIVAARKAGLTDADRARIAALVGEHGPDASIQELRDLTDVHGFSTVDAALRRAKSDQRQAQGVPGTRPLNRALEETVRVENARQNFGKGEASKKPDIGRRPDGSYKYADYSKAGYDLGNLTVAEAALPDQGAVHSQYQEKLRQINGLQRQGAARVGSKDQYYRPMTRKLEEAAQYVNEYGGNPDTVAKLRALADIFRPQGDTAPKLRSGEEVHAERDAMTAAREASTAAAAASEARVRSTKAYDKLLATEGAFAVQNPTMRKIIEQMEMHGWEITGHDPQMDVTTAKAPDGRTMSVQFISSKKPHVSVSNTYNAPTVTFKAALAHVVTPTHEESGKPSINAAMHRLGLPEINSSDHTMRPLEDMQREMQQSLGGSYTYTDREITPEVLDRVTKRLRTAAAANRQVADQKAEFNRGFMSGGGEDASTELNRQRADQFEQVADELTRMDTERKAYLAERDRRAAAPLDIRPGRSAFEGKPKREKPQTAAELGIETGTPAAPKQSVTDRKIASLEKKVETLQGRVGMAYDKRTSKGARIQSSNESKARRQLEDARRELQVAQEERDTGNKRASGALVGATMAEVDAAMRDTPGSHRDNEAAWKAGIAAKLGLPGDNGEPHFKRDSIDITGDQIKVGDFISDGASGGLGFQVAGIARNDDGTLSVYGPGMMSRSHRRVAPNETLSAWRPGVSDANLAPLQPEEADLHLMARRTLEGYGPPGSPERRAAAERLRAGNASRAAEKAGAQAEVVAAAATARDVREPERPTGSREGVSTDVLERSIAKLRDSLERTRTGGGENRAGREQSLQNQIDALEQQLAGRSGTAAELGAGLGRGDDLARATARGPAPASAQMNLTPGGNARKPGAPKQGDRVSIVRGVTRNGAEVNGDGEVIGAPRRESGVLGNVTVVPMRMDDGTEVEVHLRNGRSEIAVIPATREGRFAEGSRAIARQAMGPAEPPSRVAVGAPGSGFAEPPSAVASRQAFAAVAEEGRAAAEGRSGISEARRRGLEAVRIGRTPAGTTLTGLSDQQVLNGIEMRGTDTLEGKALLAEARRRGLKIPGKA